MSDQSQRRKWHAYQWTALILYSFFALAAVADIRNLFSIFGIVVVGVATALWNWDKLPTKSAKDPRALYKHATRLETLFRFDEALGIYDHLSVQHDGEPLGNDARISAAQLRSRITKDSK